jgi:hypothetical protein
MSYIYGSPTKRKLGNTYNEKSTDLLAIDPQSLDHVAPVEWAIDAVVDIAQSVPGLQTLEVHTKLSFSKKKVLIVFVPVESVKWEDFKHLSFPVGWSFQSIGLSMGQDVDVLLRRLRISPGKARYVHFGFVVNATQSIGTMIESMKAAILLHNPLRSLKWIFQHDQSTLKQTCLRCDIFPAFTKIGESGSRLLVQDSSGISRSVFSLGPLGLVGTYVYREGASLTQSSVTNAFVEIMRVKEDKAPSAFMDLAEPDEDLQLRLDMPDKPFIRDINIITSRLTVTARTQRVRVWTSAVSSVVKTYEEMMGKVFGPIVIGVHAAYDDHDTFLVQSHQSATLFSVDVTSTMFDNKVSGVVCLLDGACGLLDDSLPVGTLSKYDLRHIKEKAIDDNFEKLKDLSSASLKPQLFRQPSPVLQHMASQSPPGFLSAGIKRQRTSFEDFLEDDNQCTELEQQAPQEYVDARSSPVSLPDQPPEQKDSPEPPEEQPEQPQQTTSETSGSEGFKLCTNYVVTRMRAKAFAKVCGRGGIRYGPMYEALVQAKLEEEFAHASKAFGVTRADFMTIVRNARN